MSCANVEKRMRFSSVRWLLRICQIATKAKIRVIQSRTVLWLCRNTGSFRWTDEADSRKYCPQTGDRQRVTWRRRQSRSVALEIDRDPSLRGRAGPSCFGWTQPGHEQHHVVRRRHHRQLAAQRARDLRVNHEVRELATAPSARTHP